MKKFSAILLAAAMILSLAACGGKTEPDTQDVTDAPQTPSEVTESTSFPEGDPAEYSREYC